MSTQCQGIKASQDILGIGIRVNFYYTMVFLAIIPRTPHTEELLNALYANAGLSGLGLLVTAVVQTVQKQLSLFEALFILHILFFLGTGAAPMGKYHWSRSRIVMGVFVQFTSVLGFTGWALYLWIYVKHFGPQPECNDYVKYVVMFFTVGATAPWLRILWIILLVGSALGLVVGFGVNAFFLLTMQHEEDNEEEEPEKTWYFSISIPLFLSAIYSTVMLELTVRRNSTNHHGVVTVDNSWAFGQILSVVMIVANLNEVLHFLFGFFARRRKSARERQAEEEMAVHEVDGRSTTVAFRPRGLPSRDAPQVNTSSEHEPLNLDKKHAVVSQISVDADLQMHDQPISMLR
ncbi:hypothetical protein B0F90DRAFT_1815748 [Multifurca ochricompacta]|uniref:Uncharacterized protein n=1 Tax=Multifurca ochricompacta TaxID=376703 RepID=A0AAD4QQ44_9AGAM|nr:hypothetical protein B0F90DRAFT_1815748 [Multifurca ochricompacta]